MERPVNDRLRLRYQEHLIREDFQPETITAALAALTRFEQFTKGRAFHLLRASDVLAFRIHLSEEVSAATGKELSASTVVHVLGHCRAFFEWLKKEKGYRRIDQKAIDYFKAPKRMLELARNPSPRPVPTVSQILEVISAMPIATLEQRRDRALVAFLILFDLRADAAASMRCNLLNFDDQSMRMDASVVRNKFEKSGTIFSIPFVELERMLKDWVNELRRIGVPKDGPLFPKELSGGLQIGRKGGYSCWSTSAPIRRIVRNAFESAGFEYYNPHTFRKAITNYALERNPTIEEIVALSINLGHKLLITTLEYYGRPSDARRRVLIRNLFRPERMTEAGELATAFITDLAKRRPVAAAKIMNIILDLNEQ